MKLTQMVEDIVAEDAQVIYGAVIDENLNEDELTVTVVATGLIKKHQGLQLIILLQR